MTVCDVARSAAVSEKTVRRAIRRGELIAIKLGRCLRITPQAYEEWIARSRVAVEVAPRRQPIGPTGSGETGSLARLRAMEDAA